MRGAAVTELYFRDGWQCVVEATAAGGVTKEYVYGEGIDEVLKARLPDAADLDSDSNTPEKVDLYYHQNSLGSVVAVTDAAGDVVESYRYSPYGEVSVFDAAGSATAGNATLVEQPFMFTGRRWDFEEGSGLYYYRMRYYDPVVGRFVQRDPLGMWGDPAQKGNGQSYCGGDPVNRFDPWGLDEVMPNGDWGAVGPMPDTWGNWWERQKSRWGPGGKEFEAGGEVDKRFFDGHLEEAEEAESEEEEALALAKAILAGLRSVYDILSGARNLVKPRPPAPKAQGKPRTSPSDPTPTDRHKEQLLERPGKDKRKETAAEGARREAGGENTGHDHGTKVRNSVRGLKRRIGEIKRELAREDLTPCERKALQKELREASQLIDYGKKALGEGS